MSETAPAPAAAPAASPPPAGSRCYQAGARGLAIRAATIRASKSGLCQGIRSLLERADDPVQLNKAEFQHRIAYAVADAQSNFGPLSSLDAEARERLNELSVTAPGLINERAQSFSYRRQQRRQDSALRIDIRRTAIRDRTPGGPKHAADCEPTRSIRKSRKALQPSTCTSRAVEYGLPGRSGQQLAAGLDAAGRPTTQDNRRRATR